MKVKNSPSKSFSNHEDAESTASCLDRIFKKINDVGLCDEAIPEIAEDLKRVCARFPINTKSAVLFAAIIEYANTNCGINAEILANYIGCSNIEFLGFMDSIKEMEDQGLLYTMGTNMKSFAVTPEAVMAVERSIEFTPVKSEGLDYDQFFSLVRTRIMALKRGASEGDRFNQQIETLIAGNQQLPFCRKVAALQLPKRSSPEERRVFYYLCYRYARYAEQDVEIDTLMNLVDYFEDESVLRRNIGLEKTTLHSMGLVAFPCDGGYTDTGRLALSDTVMKTFFEGLDVKVSEDRGCRDIIRFDSISPVSLFYNRRETEQIAALENLLTGDNLVSVQVRMGEMGMRRGFNVLFYGSPGVGKTACVYELARRTGRDIYMVDMSELKSKWVGESEKCVKNVFTTYRRLVRRSSRCPILLFNEADAIFSKRLTDVTDSVDQMMNSIQNIVLQELENLDGVLIATTNLAGNLDRAFDRRFIFKIRFDRPEEKTRAKIWKSMMPSLSETEACSIASEFPLSGGNIENVSRKCSVNYILKGEQPTDGLVRKYCQEESAEVTKEKPKIGF